MKVILNEKALLNIAESSPDKALQLELLLKKNKEYTVYAISFSIEEMSYLICDEIFESSNYPFWHDASLFVIKCNSVSRYWCVKNNIKKELSLLIPRSFLNNELLYQELLEGKRSAYEKFIMDKMRIDAEADIGTLIDKLISELSYDLSTDLLADGWHKKCQETMLLILNDLKKIIHNKSVFGYNPDSLMLLKVLQRQGVCSGNLHKSFVRLESYINILMSPLI